MIIQGLQKTTLLDFPGKVAATVFTAGCNFRCPFCHNASLVTHIDGSNTIPEEEVLDYLRRRKGILDGVCITGGEPLLQPDIDRFCRKVKELGLLVKLDTNGALPLRLRALIDAGLVDYVAMDVKNSFEKYAETCGLTMFPEGVRESIALLMEEKIPYEFRTTVTREFHTKESIEALARQIGGARRYFLQGFIDSGDLIGEGLSAYSAEEMNTLLELCLPYVPAAELRGI